MTPQKLDDNFFNISNIFGWNGNERILIEKKLYNIHSYY